MYTRTILRAPLKANRGINLSNSCERTEIHFRRRAISAFFTFLSDFSGDPTIKSTRSRQKKSTEGERANCGDISFRTLMKRLA